MRVGVEPTPILDPTPNETLPPAYTEEESSSKQIVDFDDDDDGSCGGCAVLLLQSVSEQVLTEEFERSGTDNIGTIGGIPMSALRLALTLTLALALELIVPLLSLLTLTL